MTTQINIKNTSKPSEFNNKDHVIEVRIPGYESRFLRPDEETSFYVWDPLVVEIREFSMNRKTNDE